MHNREKSKNPSFSSTLLDEIYRSIDKNEGENQWQKKAQVEDEEIASFRRACLIEKWMEKKVKEKNFMRKPPLIPDFEKDNDTLFFSSTSISSVSSSGVLSSSDTEYFAAVEKTKKSCFFGSSFPKPIKTKLSVSSSSQKVPHSETEDSMKSRLEALKIYANLKNSKQPISPGARLTSFINSLFTNASSKKSKSRKSNGSAVCKHSVGSEEKYGHSVYTGSEEKTSSLKGLKIERKKSKSTQTSACSSSTSFSRLCLSKFPRPPISRDKMALSEDVNLEVEKRSIGEEEGAQEDDARSDCSSSELFEIDHLVSFGKKRFSEDLPVYETTDVDKNRAIARGMMR